MGKLWREKSIFREVKRELYERVVIPTIVYGSETWSLSSQERRKIEVFKMTCLRNIFGMRRVRNAIIRERCGCELSELERIERNVLHGSGMWKEWERKGWLKECTGQMWRVTGEEGNRREDGGRK